MNNSTTSDGDHMLRRVSTLIFAKLLVSHGYDSYYAATEIMKRFGINRNNAQRYLRKAREVLAREVGIDQKEIRIRHGQLIELHWSIIRNPKSKTFEIQRSAEALSKLYPGILAPQVIRVERELDQETEEIVKAARADDGLRKKIFEIDAILAGRNGHGIGGGNGNGNGAQEGTSITLPLA